MDQARAMIRSALVIPLLVIAGCSQFGHGKADSDDKYAVAASSWVGSNIMEMAAAWPYSMPHCGSKKGGASGCVWWRHSGGIVSIPFMITRAAPNSI